MSDAGFLRSRFLFELSLTFVSLLLLAAASLVWRNRGWRIKLAFAAVCVLSVTAGLYFVKVWSATPTDLHTLTDAGQLKTVLLVQTSLVFVSLLLGAAATLVRRDWEWRFKLVFAALCILSVILVVDFMREWSANGPTNPHTLLLAAWLSIQIGITSQVLNKLKEAKKAKENRAADR